MIPDEHRQLGYRAGTATSRMRSFFFRALAVAASIVLLIGAIAVSIVVFAIALTVLAVFFGFLWWRTRQLRRDLRARQPDANVIEGEIVRRYEQRDNAGPRER